MSGIDILIDNGTVVTMDPQRRVIENASVAVQAGRILDVGPSERAAPQVHVRQRRSMPAAR